MEANRRSFASVSSIQAQPIKPGLVVDAITSAALAAITRALVVEISLRVRVIAISPAAIATPMVGARFAGRADDRRQLNKFHPAGQINQLSKVARLAVFLLHADCTFITGICLAVDVAIGGRLHEPA